MMMRALLSTTMIFLATTVALAQPEIAQVRKEIEDFYAKCDRIVMRGDCDAMMDVMDPSFVMVDTQGNRMNYKDMRAMMETMRKSMKGSHCHSDVKHVQLSKGDEVVAWVEMNVSYKMKSGKKWVPISMTARFAETLRYTPTGWKSTYAQELPVNEPWSFKTG